MYGVVIEEDPSVLALAVRILGRHYRVLGFRLVKEGAEYLSNASFVVMDCDLREGLGETVLALARVGGIRAPLLLTSGYEREACDNPPDPDLVIRFLAKPYSPARLLEEIASLLDTVPSQPCVSPSRSAVA